MERLVNGELVQVDVSALNDDGLGEGRVAGAAAVIGNGLPGERGEALVVHRGQNKSVLRLFELKGSAHSARVAAECPRWTPASPCRLMHTSGEFQLEFKRDLVRRALQAQGQGANVAPTVSAGKQTGWRSRVIYLARQHRGQALLGAYRRGSHQVQGMLDCLLPEPALLSLSEALVAILQEFRALLPHATAALDPGCGEPLELNQLRANLGRPVSPTTRGSDGELHYVTLRANAAGDCMVCFLGDLTPDTGRELAKRCLKAGATSVFVGASGPGDAVFGAEAPTWVAGAKSLLDEVDGLSFELLPRTFFQVHRSAAARLQRDALAHVVGERVLDVFSGVGALALRAAQSGRRVTAIESVPEARALALSNAERNGLELELVGSEADQALQTLLDAERAFDTVFVNPPRKGLGPGVAPRLLELAPERIVYVSCNPKSLARDLSALGQSYRLTSVTPYDLFPASEHVETLAVLERA
ncbi:MAG: class I SAM-dependent RNA methyltransferase [Polyangiaceae bacterium]|nr:class I SAM-dependent RNA methyltransferase [Myxococcales bacterium]MCB9584455.1 class I SAM-dependent RNA methyltransferase [Polyangiaceae bacterium]MCB9609298.1 class I SAM-dependent RNA methyltransferase [Polyangiaceae bacterium]